MAFGNNRDEKREFMTWLLKNHEMKKGLSALILVRLLADDSIDNIHFVEDVTNCPRGLIISVKDSEGIPLGYSKEGNVITQVGEILFRELPNVEDEPLYIQMNFENAEENSLYINVLEVNPYSSGDASLPKNDQEVVDEIVVKSTMEFRRTDLLRQIDEALDTGNQIRFDELVAKLRKIAAMPV